jgi:hypothetical protein
MTADDGQCVWDAAMADGARAYPPYENATGLA